MRWKCTAIYFFGLCFLLSAIEARGQEALRSQLLYTLGDTENGTSTVFGAHQSVVISRQGDLYIADHDFSEIRLFRNGEYVVSQGREGRGPGEFLGLHSMCLTADEQFIVTYHYAIPRISLFDAITLDYVRSATPEKAAGSIYNLECGVGDEILLSGYMTGETGLLHAFDIQGNYLRSYGDLASDLFEGLIPPARVQLGQAYTVGLGDDGLLVALMAPYRVAHVAPDGAIRWSIRDPFVENPIDEHIVATPDRFSVASYKGITGVYQMNEEHFGVSIYDPETEATWLDVRGVADGRRVNRHQLPTGSTILAMRRDPDSGKGWIVSRQGRPYPVIDVHEW